MIVLLGRSLGFQPGPIGEGFDSPMPDQFHLWGAMYQEGETRWQRICAGFDSLAFHQFVINIHTTTKRGMYDMYVDKLMEELERDEGIIYEIYKDHLGYPTFGIGHLIIEGDPEMGQPVGTPVSEDRVISAFNEDIQMVLDDCYRLFSDFDDLPEEAQRVVANMMFNMGYTRLNKFYNFKAATNVRDWYTAADEMIDSKWYRQVTTRADRLVNRIRNLS